MALEPLLKDEEEKIAFASNNKLSRKNKNGGLKSCLNKSVILTVILTIFVFYFFGRTSYAFYIGFKYYDLRFSSNAATVANSSDIDDVSEEVLEEVPLNSAILNTTYNKINLNNCNSLLSRFYSDSLNVEDLNLEEKLGVAISNLNNGECAANFSVSFDALNEAFVNLFNDSNLITNYQVAGETTYGNYLVNYDDVNRMFYINENACVTCDNNYLIKTISRATTDGDNLYIYESFGYFKYIDSNNYEVYDSPNETKLLTTFVDTDGTKNFTNNDILANYMWTYKKGTDNNYYFVSVTRL